MYQVTSVKGEYRSCGGRTFTGLCCLDPITGLNSFNDQVGSFLMSNALLSALTTLMLSDGGSIE